MNQTEYELEEIIDDADVDLYKAIMALEEFIDAYDWDVKPTADKANKHGLSTNHEKFSKYKEISWKLLAEPSIR